MNELLVAKEIYYLEEKVRSPHTIAIKNYITTYLKDNGVLFIN